MRQKVYASPSASKKLGYPNPYVPNLKKELSGAFDVLEADNRPCLMQGGALLRNSVKGDIFLLSFVETIAFHRLAFIQTCMALLALDIMKLRRRTIVFFFHNPRPHKGENVLSRMLTRRLFRYADLVVTHSGNTAAIAREKVREDKVLVCPIPFEPAVAPVAKGPECDVLIWGSIFPYKGIAEFIADPAIATSGLKIDIIGECRDAALAEKITALAKGSIQFENRRAEMEEVASRVAGSRIVLFPYLPGSVSGSGSLTDTLRFGGNPVGPDAGAFRDLAAQGLCKVYSKPSEVLEILESGWKVDASRLDRYIEENSWSAFAEKIIKFVR